MRRKLNDNNQKDITTYVLGLISLIILIGIGVVYYNLTKPSKNSTSSPKSSDFVAQVENKTTNNTSMQQASSQIGKTVNETKEENNAVNSTTNKIAINTNSVANNTEENVSSNEQKQEEPKEEKEEKKELVFAKPVEGDIVKEFAKDTLIYSNTLNEWTTHLGVDIKAEKTTVVKASEEGTVKYIKNDPRYGLTVVIEHNDGYSTVYANLLTSEFVVEGEKVEKGQSIGTVGNTAVFEISDESHLHFEIIKDGIQLDPNIYLK